MSTDKTYLGRKMMDFSSSPAFQPYSRVTLWVDDNNCYTAGDDTGRTLEADCPWATQAICNAVLAKISGYQYVPYTATDAMLDPAAEIGDGVTANGRYSVLASIEPTFDSMFTATVQAPSDEELDHEFPYKSSTTRSFDRKLAQTRAAITVKADEIMLEVQNELDGLSSSLSVSIDEIRAQVSGKIDGTQAQTLIQQGIKDITISASAGSNQSTISISAGGVVFDTAVVKFSNIVADEVSADNIVGSLLSDQIDLYGDLTVYTNSRLTKVGGYLGYTSSTLDGSDGIHIAKGKNEVRVTANGAAIESVSSSFIAASNATISSNNAVRLLGDGGCYSNGETITSDRRLKDKVDYNKPTKEASIIDGLKPCAFEYTQWQKGKKHFGFIAQDVVELLNKYGYGETDIIVGKDPETEMYALAYTEFIPLLVAKIQQMDARIKELKVLSA